MLHPGKARLPQPAAESLRLIGILTVLLKAALPEFSRPAEQVDAVIAAVFLPVKFRPPDAVAVLVLVEKNLAVPSRMRKIIKQEEMTIVTEISANGMRRNPDTKTGIMSRRERWMSIPKSSETRISARENPVTKTAIAATGKEHRNDG